MWRDMNVFNELGVPAVSYGFRTGYIGDASERSAQDELNTFHVRIPDLVDCSKIYALTALGICSEPRS